MDPRITPDIIEAAKATQRSLRVPSSVSIAQWACESAYGKEMPAGSNNPFGIKWNGTGPYVECPTHEVIGGVRRLVTQKFAKYDSLAAAFVAHGHLLATVKLYASAMSAWLRGDLASGVTLMAAHYATDPHYAATILSIINANGLAAFDHQVAMEGAGKPSAAKAIAKPVSVPVAASAGSVAVATVATGHPVASAGFGVLAVLSALASWLLHRTSAPAVTIDPRIAHVDLASISNSPAAPAAAASVIPQAATEATTMNPIAAFTLAFSLAKDFAPYVPQLVKDVPKFVADIEKIVADASKLDVSASLADVQKIIADAEAELPLILQVIKAGKGLAVS